MNCVGIDVSKGKSMIAVMRPLGEVVIPPFEVGHTESELCELSKLLGNLDGETRVVMETTGNYHLPVFVAPPVCFEPALLRVPLPCFWGAVDASEQARKCF